MTRVCLYWDWVRSEAALIDSDGCSKVSGLCHECCWEHDLAFYYAKDPRDSYRHYLAGALEEWALAKPITFDEANARFRKCHVSRTKLGWLNPMVWWRYGGVRWGAKSAWDDHRAAEAAEQTGA